MALLGWLVSLFFARFGCFQFISFFSSFFLLRRWSVCFWGEGGNRSNEYFIPELVERFFREVRLGEVMGGGG